VRPDIKPFPKKEKLKDVKEDAGEWVIEGLKGKYDHKSNTIYISTGDVKETVYYLSHEYLHHVLYKFVEKKAGEKLDNLYLMLNDVIFGKEDWRYFVRWMERYG